MIKKKMGTVADLIKDSGNEFHFKVVKYLRGKDWSVLISPYYTDNITDKSREIDIIAEKIYDIKPKYRDRDKPKKILTVRLFIECKCINGNIVFWFDKKDKNQALERIQKDTPLNLRNGNTLINNHHYLKNDRVAKLYTKSKGEESEKDVFYNACIQSLHSMIYYRDCPTIFLYDSDENSEENYPISYPIVLCDSFAQLYKAEDVSNIVDNYFELEMHYAYKKRGKSENEYFLIDAVDFNKFDDFWDEIEKKDIRSIRDFIRYNEE